MVFEELLSLAGNLPCFDLPLVAQAAMGESKPALRVQLSRWMAQGKLLHLRRGVYAFAPPYARASASPPELSGLLYSPSYLSGVWALGYYGLIPERVVELTAVTTRVPRLFQNAFGVFSYRHIKRAMFFGYRQTGFAGRKITVAEPEKALLDHWHLTPGEWTPERIEAMRYQNAEVVDTRRLAGYAGRFDSPRLLRATRRWLEWRAREDEGDILP
ncbi:MAG: hypothetical protein LBT74_12590 [Acidobacteriota bacterium]|jgi:predicted transcriptional regulator of viral defense system|nr:hypothetical protein [Acidobacteriota bacterium]